MSRSGQQQTAFEVGEWQVKPSLNRIAQGARVHDVEPKVMQVLVRLAERPGDVISREELLETVWVGTYVTNVTLTRCISELRKVLGDDPQTPQYIETIRKTGYRLIAPVSRKGEAAALQPFERVQVGKTPSWVWGIGLGGLIAVLILGIVEWGGTGGQALPVNAEPLLPFTSLPGMERYPAVVPHGDQVVFAWEEPKSTQVDLYLKQVNSADLVRLTDDPGTEAWPTWRSDSKAIAFVRYSEAGCHLYLMNALGGDEQEMVPCMGPHVEGLAWSPSSEWLIYAAQLTPNDPYQLIGYSTRTQAHIVLTTPDSTSWGDRSPAFQNNETVAFVRSQIIGDDDVFLLDLATEQVRQLTQGRRPIDGITWTQDAERLVFSSNRDGQYSLWQVGAAGGQPARLGMTHTGHVRLPQIPRLSYGLAVEQVREDANLVLIGGEEERIAVSTEDEHDPAISSSGNAVAFVSERSGSPQVWVYQRDPQRLRQVTQFEQALIYDPSWSPDDTHIAFSVREGAVTQVYVASLLEAGVRALTEAPQQAYHPRWSDDGTSVYWTSAHTGAWQIWRAPVTGGKAEQITQQGGYHMAPSVDGQSVYFTKYRDRALWQLDVETQGTQLINPAFLQHPDEEWAYQNGYLYRWGATRQALFAIHADSLDKAPRRLPAPQQRALDFAVAPQEAFVVYSVQDRSERDVWLHRTFYNQ